VSKSQVLVRTEAPLGSDVLEGTHVSPSKKEIAQECESSSVLCAERQTSSLAGHENSRRMEALRAMLSWFVQGVVTKGLMERELFGGDLLPMVQS
jgi:hypothetical protein